MELEHNFNNQRLKQIIGYATEANMLITENVVLGRLMIDLWNQLESDKPCYGDIISYIDSLCCHDTRKLEKLQTTNMPLAQNSVSEILLPFMTKYRAKVVIYSLQIALLFIFHLRQRMKEFACTQLQEIMAGAASIGGIHERAQETVFKRTSVAKLAELTAAFLVPREYNKRVASSDEESNDVASDD